MDFNDLQVLPVHGLRDEQTWLRDVAGKMDEIIVDEAQDTNLVQYRLIYLLGKAAPGSVVMVGDDDQTIYGWRGAAPDNLQRFKRDFQPAEVHLSNNYRSTPEIVAHANRLIVNNKDRLEKEANATAAAGGHKPCLSLYRTGSAMADRVADQIQQAIADGTPPGAIAVLYRTNRLAKLVEPELLARGVPYQVQKGTELNKRQEVQMLFAAIRLAINPDDAPALTKMMTLVKGFGEKKVETLLADNREKAGTDSYSLLDRTFQHTPTTTVTDALLEFHDAITALKEDGPEKTNLFRWAMDFESFREWMKKLSKTASNPGANMDSRVENIAMFARAIEARIDADGGVIGDTMEDKWQTIMELTLSTPDEETSTRNKVTLSTVHKSKGLEWDHVHVFGFSDGLMPAVTDVAGDDDEEGAEGLPEERRLAYVAMTRAAKELHLHHAYKITLPGQDRQFILSRFAKEAGIEPTKHKGRKRREYDVPDDRHDERKSSTPAVRQGENPLMARRRDQMPDKQLD